MGRKAILVTSFGTSYNETREKTIDAIERRIAEAFPEWEVRRAWTSRMIIKKLKERDGTCIDYITDAMEKLSEEGFEKVVVQPTHIMNGTEYDDVVKAVDGYIEKIPDLRVGRALLTTIEDYDAVVEAIRSCLLPLCGERDLVLMGHGTEHYANATYCQLQMKLRSAGIDNVYITTVEGYPEFEDTLRLMNHRKCRKAVAIPFMIVAGDHAINDMAGDDDDSLRHFLESNGYETECIVRGLGEFPGFRDLFVQHIRDAMGAE